MANASTPIKLYDSQSSLLIVCQKVAVLVVIDDNIVVAVVIFIFKKVKNPLLDTHGTKLF